MFGTQVRADNHRLRRLADSRGQQVGDQRKHITVLTDNQARLIRRHGDLMQLVALHIVTSGHPEQLRAALLRAGFAAELEYALHETNSTAHQEATS